MSPDLNREPAGMVIESALLHKLLNNCNHSSTIIDSNCYNHIMYVITLTQTSYNDKDKKLRYVFYMKKNSLIYKMSWRKDWGLGSPMGVQF